MSIGRTSLLLLAFLISPLSAQPRPAVEDRALIVVVDGLDAAVDAKDWARARQAFASDVRLDVSAMTGSPPGIVTADSIIAGWADNLKPSKTSLHLRTNHLVTWEGEVATVTSHGYAWNRLEGNGDPLWEVWGVYRHELRRLGDAWKVTAFTFRPTHERGNLWVKTHVPPN